MQRDSGTVVARIYAGLTTSHVPAIGAALDNGKAQEPYWRPLFQGYEFARSGSATIRPTS
jgi:protocatechuate 4,5-dioxygenase beta chain